jgi:copper(I)-binding protein
MIYRIAARIVLILAAALPQAGRAEPAHIEPGEPGIIVSDAWTRPSSAGGTAAVYLRVANTGTVRDRLIRAETPVASRAEVHTHVMEGDVMKMRRLDSIEVMPNESLALEPGGLHVMLFDLTKPLAPGDSFPLTLVFERTGAIATQVEVRGSGSK